MARSRTVFVCSECGHEALRWTGQCDACQAWNTLAEIRVSAAPSGTERSSGTRQAIALPEVEASASVRWRLPIEELNRVLGGGVVPGSLILLGGEPGIGKSTLVLQAAAALAEQASPVLYVTGEESAEQVKLRADRLGIHAARLFILAETDLDAVFAQVETLGPMAIVVDSIQTMETAGLSSGAGSVTQVRDCAARFLRLAKDRRAAPVFLVGHVTKAGDLAGPRVVEHMVDVVLYLEGDRYHSYRLLRAVKNRFGSTNEIGVFEMRPDGMVEIANPSEVFLAERLAGVSGSAVTVTLEGSRPLLVEVQALVSPTGMQVPRRTANGIDTNRLILLCAVLTKRLGLSLAAHDVFVNVVGGLRVSEPAVDLATAIAIASSAQNQPIPEDLAIVGEIGLSGELRSVSQLERRLAEAANLGFRRAVVPMSALGRREARPATAIKVLGARTLAEALDIALES